MERILDKIGRIKLNLNILYSIKDDCVNKFRNDPIYRGALIHYLYITADSCIYLAEQIIKYKKLKLPQSYSESIEILGDNGIIDPEFSYDFARISGFRNFLAHDYEDINKDIICNDIINRLEEIEEYIRLVGKYFKL